MRILTKMYGAVLIWVQAGDFIWGSGSVDDPGGHHFMLTTGYFPRILTPDNSNLKASSAS